MITGDFLRAVFSGGWHLVTEILKLEFVATEWGPVTGYSIVAMSAILTVVKWSIEAYVSRTSDRSKGKSIKGTPASTGTGGRLPK